MQLRIKYGKQGRLRFIGHRDLARAHERALRVAQVPLAFTEGFSPHPKISFGHALPVGAESIAEYLDITTREDIDIASLAGSLQAALPEGMPVFTVAPILRKVQSLQEATTSFEWLIHLTGTPDAVTGMPTALSADIIRGFVDQALALEALQTARQRKGETISTDARPALLGLEFHSETDLGAMIRAEIATKAGVRPNEVVAACVVATQCPVAVERFSRQEQWIQHGSERVSPLAPAIIGAPTVEEERVA